MNWRTRSESRLERMGELITIHPKKIIIFMLLISILIISNITKITIDTSTEGFLHDTDPALIRYEKFKEQFGQDEKILVVIQAKNVFNLEILQKIQTLHKKLENEVSLEII